MMRMGVKKGQLLGMIRMTTSIRNTTGNSLIFNWMALLALAHIVLAKKEVGTTSVAHVLLRLPPTQDPCDDVIVNSKTIEMEFESWRSSKYVNVYRHVWKCLPRALSSATTARGSYYIKHEHGQWQDSNLTQS
ncbi:hypothetical protein Tco_0925620 [Tanacetum coccineum]|uniref:Uncharacterized protein n=1 Tax=Tanacetum coccineum TaxID=301880 RepID=A0ABQ5D7D9_9ASTR